MTDSLANFLVDMAADPDRLAAFLSDPAAAADRGGLTDEEKAAVVARDAPGIRRALAAPDDPYTNSVNDAYPGDDKRKPGGPGKGKAKAARKSTGGGKRKGSRKSPRRKGR
jgi:hypothetical protein